MPVLDNASILVTQVFTGIILFFFSLFFKEKENRVILRHYRLANLCYALGFLLLLQLLKNPFINIIIANTLILACYAFFVSTSLMIFDITPSKLFLFGILIINTVFFHIYTFVYPSTLARIVILQCSGILILLYGIIMTIKNRNAEDGQNIKLFIGTSGGYAAVSLFRIIHTVLAHKDITNILSADAATGLTFLTTIAYHIAMNSIIFLQVTSIARIELHKKVILLENSYNDIRELSSFFDHNKNLTSPDELYTKISEFITRRFKIEGVSIFLKDQVKKTIHLVYNNGFPLSEIPNMIPLESGSITARAIVENRFIQIAVADYPDNQYKQHLAKLDFQHLYSIPINTASERLGAMTLGSKTACSLLEKEKDIFSLITNQIGTILENMIQYQNMEHLAMVDPLTDILNRRAFYQKFSEMIKYVKRYQRPLSFLIFDIDDFKTINDKYGHEAGDTILKRTVETTKHLLRETDTLGRFGGEEFIILMVETTWKQAFALSERLRKSIKKMETPINDITAKITISIGLTSISGEDTIKTAFARADKALYRAKASGKNLTVASN